MQIIRKGCGFMNTSLRNQNYKLRHAISEKDRIEDLKQTFKKQVGYELNLEDPKTMNEKIMWLKLYYQDPMITVCSDKYRVKDYVTEKVGKKYIVPTIASWTNAEDIDFDKLPDSFVLKVNWSSGFNIIVPDKSKLDVDKTRKQLTEWIKPENNSYYQMYNWGYKHMKPVIYAEEYIEQIDGQVYDYKFYFSHENFLYMFIATDRHGDHTLTYTFFDSDLQKIDCFYGNKPNANPEMPKKINEMLDVAKKLASPFPYVRVDFYEIGEKIYVGEMTFYSGGGVLPFNPPSVDTYLGSKIPLPKPLITDKDSFSNRVLSSSKKTLRTMRKVGTALVHKEIHQKQKYLVCVGIRLPYTTHFELDEGKKKKYISILGTEFCYKKQQISNAKKLNSNTEFKYEPLTQQDAFMMEGIITPEIQRIHCEQKAYKQLGYFPDLRNPKTLNEKILWLALHYKNPNIAIATDKATAKEWISSRVGAEYVVPLIGVYTDVNDIDFDSLPEHFVAKLNDGWGADKVMIIRDKLSLDIDKTKAVLSSWLYPWNNYYYQNLCITDEKMVEPKIIIEEYLDANNEAQVPDDFKFYCCNGKPQFALVVANRGTKEQTRAFVNMNWEIMPVSRKGYKRAETVACPQHLEVMQELAQKLSKGFPFVRIDFYEVDGKVYVGEMTFTPGMFLKFSSKGWDLKLGNYLDLHEAGYQEGGSHDL